MGLLQDLKATASRALVDNGVLKNAAPKITAVLSRIEGSSAEFLTDLELFRARISDPTYNQLPAVIQRFVTPDKWHHLVLGVKDSIFIIEAQKIRLHPTFRAGAHEFVLRLVYAERWVEHVAKEPEVPVETQPISAPADQAE